MCEGREKKIGRRKKKTNTKAEEDGEDAEEDRRRGVSEWVGEAAAVLLGVGGAGGGILE